jgi:hypothetical protein
MHFAYFQFWIWFLNGCVHPGYVEAECITSWSNKAPIVEKNLYVCYFL